MAMIASSSPPTSSYAFPPSAYDTHVAIHDLYGLVLTFVAGVGAVAAIVSIMQPWVLPAVRMYLRVTTALVAAQVVIGLILVATGHRPAQLIHWF